MTNTEQVRWTAIIAGAIGVVVGLHMVWQVSIPFYLLVGIITIVLIELNIITFGYVEVVGIALLLSVLGWGIAFYRREKQRIKE